VGIPWGSLADGLGDVRLPHGGGGAAGVPRHEELDVLAKADGLRAGQA